MSTGKRIVSSLVVLSFCALNASAAGAYPWIDSFKSLAYAVAWLMMVVLGMKWIAADSANERLEAKKGMMYVVIGILVAASLCGLMCIYCTSATQSMTAGGLTFNCDMAAIGCPNC